MNIPDSYKMNTQKRILYISNVDLSGKFIPGVIEKIKGQTAAFRRNGFSVDVLYPTNSGLLVIEKEDGSRLTFKGANPFYTSKGLLHKLVLHLRLAWIGNINFRYAEKAILGAMYDGIYLRFYLPGSGLIRFLKKVKSQRNKPLLLLEYPTLNVNQIIKDDLARRVSYIINEGRIKKLNQLSDYIVTLTKDRKLFGKPALFMPNGLDLTKINVLRKPELTNTIILLGVASDCAHYHGYDKVIKGMYEYKKAGLLPMVRFRIISSLLGHNIEFLRNLIKEFGLEDDVVFLDIMERKESEKQYQQVHIGVGTLALHRVGLMDNYSLKHREYAAFGLPFVMSKGDDVFEQSPFVMTVERNEEPIDIAALVKFYTGIWNKETEYTTNFRASMENLITWDAQLMEIFTAFRNVTSD